MASTYSTNLKIELIGTGEQAGTWGTTTNSNLGTALEQAIVGKADVAMSSTTVTLTLTNSNAAQDARAIYLNLTGSPGGAAVLEVPAIEKPYIVKNGSDQQVTIKVSGQTGVPIPTTKTALVYNNGTDVVTSLDYIPSLTLGAALPVASGGTGATTLTANNVVIGNGTSAVQFVAPGTSGNLLTSNGTTWTSAPPAAGGIEYEVKTANYTAADKEGILADTSGGAFTVTLPATPSTGAQVIVADPTGDWGTNNLTIGRNGETIADVAQDLICDISGASVQLVYDGTTWAVYAQVGGNGGTVVTEAGTQTLTNKTLTDPKVNGSSTVGGKVDLLEASNNGTNFVALKAPDTLASDVTFTLPDADGTSGQLLQTNGSGVLSFSTVSSGFTLGTPVATTSGTSIDFTGIPAGVKEINVMFREVSWDAVVTLIVQLGDSGGVETTNYLGTYIRIRGGASARVAKQYSNGFALAEFDNISAASNYNGILTIKLLNSSTNIYAGSSIMATSNAEEAVGYGAGTKALSAVLDRVRITTFSGTANFDSGEVNISYI